MFLLLGSKFKIALKAALERQISKDSSFIKSLTKQFLTEIKILGIEIVQALRYYWGQLTMF
jgi:hypothetical protein